MTPRLVSLLTFGGLLVMVVSIAYWNPVLGAFTAGLVMCGIGLLGARTEK